jgi:2-keto-4-pentenoate hydratase
VNEMTLQACSQALVQAYRTGTQLDATPVAAALRDAADAYTVMEQVAEAQGWLQGDVASPHWKSGGASREATLTHCALPPGSVWPSPANAQAWPMRMRLIEAEVALRLARDVDAAQAAQIDSAQAFEWVDAMTVSIELIDSRWQQGLEAPALCKLADRQCNSALVLGEWVPFERRDWTQQVCRVQIGDGAAQEWRGTHSLKDPTWLLPIWLRHATRQGRRVAAGTVVTTGTWVGMLPVQAGQRVEAEFPGIGRASVQY